MTTLFVKQATTAMLAGLFMATAVSTVLADVKDYEFRLVKSEIKMGDAIIDVRLLNNKTQKAVPDAVIFARRLDMAPEGMPTMTAELEPLPLDEPGIYRFRTNLTMEGGWQLSLAAKVQGESGTLQARLGLKAQN